MKIITSPVKRFPGTVELPDFFSWAQLAAWQDAIDRASKAANNIEAIRCQTEAIIGMGLAWHVAGIPENPTLDQIPATPVKSACELIGWLFGEIGGIITEDEAIPNA